MLNKLIDILVYNVFQAADSRKVQARIMEDNRRFAVIWSTVLMCYWAYSLIMSTRDASFHQCRGIYAAAFCVCAASLALALFAAPGKTNLIRLVAVALDCSFLWAGVGIAVFLAPRTIVVFASVLIIPVLFISDSLSTIVLLLIDIMIFSIVGSLKMDHDTFRWTITNMVIFGSAGAIVGYCVNKARFERYYFAEAAVQLAESKSKLADLQTRYAYYDQMTALKNRRAYSEKVTQLSETPPVYCCVIMADINGLKEANDTMGHEAGDELIVGAADCLRQSFQGVDTIYRLGGDEFCVILTGRVPDAAQSLKQLETLCAQWLGQYVSGISISFGSASSEELTELDAILKEADERMYAAKKQFYKNSGKTR